MGSVFTVARREYLAYVLTRGFLISVIMLPLLFTIGFFVPALIEGTAPTRHYVVVDQSGLYEEPIREGLASSHRRSVVQAWDAYVTALLTDEEREALPAPFRPDDVTEARVAAFYEEGGPDAAQQALRSTAADLEFVPDFPAPRSRLKEVALPPGLSRDQPLDQIAGGLRPYLLGDRRIEVDGKEVPLFAAILIPREIRELRPGAETNADIPPIQYWSDNLADTQLRGRIDDIVGRQLRLYALQDLGLDPETVADVRSLDADVDSFLPGRFDAAGEEDEGLDAAEVDVEDVIVTWMPVVFAYALFVGIFGVSSSLLTSTVEEKSNRIAELLVSSVRPHELMLGKLLGVASVGLTTISIYGGLALVGAVVLGQSVDLGFSPLALLLDTGLLPLFVFYFVVGYVMLASVYMAVGSLCQSLQEAQTYLGPLTLLILVPLVSMVAVQQDPNGLVARIVTWIPLYSPYALILRAPHDPPLWEMIGASLLLVVFAGLIVWLMGRIFRNSILNTGQPPKLGELVRLMRSREA